MQTAKVHKTAESDLLIPHRLLREAHLEEEELEVEVGSREIRITANNISTIEPLPLTDESPIWKWVGKESVDFNGRDHDEALYG